jgi:hypothetical protein
MIGQKVFKEIIKGDGLERTLRRGRNNSLIFKRNECLLARYYYYCHHKNKCYEEVLRLLITEFFLSPATIVHLVQDHTDQLLALKQKCPPLYFFQNRWPHFKWL